MQEAFGIVIFVVVGVAALVALWTLAGAGRLYDQIGRGGLSLNEDEPARRPAGAPPPPVDPAERDAEIRQMLEARNVHRQTRGEEPIDVEAEFARLTAPAVDPELVAEVRQLVVARNERRAARGQPPLDVEAEVARQLRELGG